MGRFVFDLDDGLHSEFKSLCATNGISMTKKLKEIICKLLEAGDIEKVEFASNSSKGFDLKEFRKALGLDLDSTSSFLSAILNAPKDTRKTVYPPFIKNEGEQS